MKRIFDTVRLAGLLLLGATLYSGAASSQCVPVSMLGTPAGQNFDTLAQTGTNVPWTDNTTLPGWYSTRTTYNAGTGSSNTGSLYSFGVAGTNAVTDRALGTVASGGTTTIFGAVCFVNNTGTALTAANIAYIGEQWRDGAPVPAAAQRLDFEYQIAATGVITDANTPTTGWTAFDALDFTGPVAGGAAGAALDGNLPANRVALGSTITAGVPIGQEFWMRWVDINDASNDHGLAVDDFSFTPVGALATDLQVIKTDSPDPVDAGANLTYTITLTNLSAVAASAVALADTVPAGTTLQSFTAPAGFACTAPAVGAIGNINCTSPSVAGAGAATFTLVVRANSNLAAGSSISNTVTVTTSTTDTNPANNTATASTTVGISSDLSLMLTDSPDPVTAGTNLTYTAIRIPSVSENPQFKEFSSVTGLKELLLNVNFPFCPRAELKGIQLTRLGSRVYQDTLVKKVDPRGQDYYWIGGEEKQQLRRRSNSSAQRVLREIAFRDGQGTHLRAGTGRAVVSLELDLEFPARSRLPFRLGVR